VTLRCSMLIPLLQKLPEGQVTLGQVPDLQQLQVLEEVALNGVQLNEHARFSQLLSKCACRVGPFALGEQASTDMEVVATGSGAAAVDDATAQALETWLDLGARRVNLELEQPRDAAAVQGLLACIQQFPDARHRLVVQVLVTRLGASAAAVASVLPSLLEELRPAVGTVQFDLQGSTVPALELAAVLKLLRGKEGGAGYIELVFSNVPSLTAALIGELHKSSNVDVLTACTVAELQDDADAPSAAPAAPINAAQALFACLRSDRTDGLIPTVVCDECSVALGLVYSSASSISASIACGRGVFWSRSRGGLWRKGDTSGAWQTLLSIETDCDSDALRFCVVQHGTPPAFCHFNRRACWAQDGGIGALERTLVARKAAAPVGSYTARLFSDSTLLRNKLVEEAQELAEAVKPDDVASEAADLTYFMLVRCAAAGVGMKEVNAWLDKRALKLKRRPGNAKAYRIAAGDAILKGDEIISKASGTS
jgi:phosphoribosyl-ATP pyrophosphohydrolase / phosphoribosyl-AMP cyclohydrolase / histidinol dehydrogenase